MRQACPSDHPEPPKNLGSRIRGLGCQFRKDYGPSSALQGGWAGKACKSQAGPFARLDEPLQGPRGLVPHINFQATSPENFLHVESSLEESKSRL